MSVNLAPAMRAFVSKTTDIVQACILYMRELKLIHNDLLCKKWKNPMKLASKPISVTQDKELWICHKCKTSASIREDSIFKVKSIYQISFFFVFVFCTVICVFIFPSTWVISKGLNPIYNSNIYNSNFDTPSSLQSNLK